MSSCILIKTVLYIIQDDKWQRKKKLIYIAGKTIPKVIRVIKKGHVLVKKPKNCI